ncbi:hypothetical protein PROFUN_01339 [Planoprotostelium fungivorum]|uniref:PAS domain-containing protein n=1 Tax=Planoprotostelium fungivorum TaxID=1890364 RepID=A0A2P6NZT9_9EUKA|nr:hypothetical protein PROFUN_01339 [Planoprotostelium fungivorum]
MTEEVPPGTIQRINLSDLPRLVEVKRRTPAVRPCKRCNSKGLVCEESEPRRKTKSRKIDQQQTPNQITQDQMNPSASSPWHLKSSKVYNSIPSTESPMHNTIVSENTRQATISQAIPQSTHTTQESSIESRPTTQPRSQYETSSFLMRDEKEELELEEALLRRSTGLVDQRSVEELREMKEKIHERIDRWRSIITSEQRETISTDFKSTLELCPVPTIIFDRSLNTHHMNEPFKQMVGWEDEPLPTTNPLPLIENSQKIFLDSQVELLHWHMGVRERESQVRTEEFRELMERQDDVYTEGHGMITIKRDQIGLPLLFVCQMIPDPPDSGGIYYHLTEEEAL